MTEREGEKTKSEAKTRKGGFEKEKKVKKKKKRGENLKNCFCSSLPARSTPP